MEENNLSKISLKPSDYVSNRQKVSPKAKEVFTEFRDYELNAFIERTPYAIQVIDLLKAKKGTIVNDHVALRTFRDKKGVSGRDTLEKIFFKFGYKSEDKIQIEPLFLDCCWYEPPEDTNWPKVFISEQQVNKLPEEAQKFIYDKIGNYYSSDALNKLLNQNAEDINSKQLFETLEIPPWNLSSKEYARLLDIAKENPNFKSALQYSAWTLIHGHRWNHFTILINALNLDELKKLEDFNSFLKDNGFPLNQWDNHEIQGSEERQLKQSSTLANLVVHEFSDRVKQEVPGSFVEFIERFGIETTPFRGFLADNARGIFSSTDAL